MAKSCVENIMQNYLVYRSGLDTTIVTSDLGTVDLFALELAKKLERKALIYKSDLTVELYDECGKMKKLSKKIECNDNNVLSAINRTIKADLSKDGLDVFGCWIGFTKNEVSDLSKSYIAQEQIKAVCNFNLREDQNK